MTDNIKRMFKGLKDVFDFYENANLSREYFIKPEYLLNVKIADRLAEKNRDFIIKLEEKTDVFSSSCVKNWNNGLTNEIHNPKRKGKIDIAVYSTETKTGHYPNKPLFPIEIKNINPQKYSFLLDIERNLYYFNIEDENTGKSIIKLAYNISIEEFNNVSTECLDRVIQEKKEKYEKWLNDSALFPKEIVYKVYTKKIDCVTYSENEKFDTREGLIETDFTNDDYCRIGIIVEIKK